MTDVPAVLASGRSETVEWVGAQTPVEDIAATLNAMANSAGGTLIVGVSDDRDIKGVEDASAAIDRVLQAAMQLEPPLIIPLPHIITVESKTLVVTVIPAGMPQVYSLRGRYLRREGQTNAPLPPAALRQLFMQRGTLSFEMEATPGATLDDLDWEKVKAYTTRLQGLHETDDNALLLRRGCLVRQGDSLLPTNAGVLLFGKTPQRFLRGAEITAARFAGETMGDTFSKHDITGTLPDQLRRAETFIVDHLRKGVKIAHTMRRKEDYEYPLEAARELVVNAVAHRDYSIAGDGIRLFIFKDRMEVISPGRLPGPVTVDNIKDERFSRNPVIVQVLSDMGFIEKLGYGVDRVIELMAQQGLREPTFEETAGGFRAVLCNTQSQVKPPVSKPEPETTGDVLRDYEGTPINPRQEAALAYLKKPGNSRITNSELQRLYPDVHPETIRRDLADLVTKDILSKLGQKRGSYYVLKKDAKVTEEDKTGDES